MTSSVRSRLGFSLAAGSIAAVLALLPHANLGAAETKPAWVSLFNGKDLAGFKAPSPALWRAEKGILVGESDEKKTGGMIWTEKSYGDFILETDVRWTVPADSGIFMRTPSLQVQLGNSHSLKRDLTGSFYMGKEGYPEALQAKEYEKYFKAGDWNTIRVEARGATIFVSINGHPVSQRTEPKSVAPGPIGVQIHQGEKMKVEFRNLRLAEL